MGFRQIMERYVQLAAARVPSRIDADLGGVPLTLRVMEAPDIEDTVRNLPVGQLWRTQPHLRTVVDYIATNVAQLNLHVFKVDDNGDRDRVREGELVELLRRPNSNSTLNEFLRALTTQMALHDEAFVLVSEGRGGPELRVVPNPWVTVHSDVFGQATGYTITALNGGKSMKVTPDQVLRFPGWSPDDPARSTSPVETLRLILAEQAQAAAFRQQIWSRSGRFMGWITRPKDAPQWDDAARQRFYKMWDAFTNEKGPRAGENPLLEDGMDYKQSRFSAKDEQWAEASKISLETVCQVYHVPPVMVGITDDANYSNVTAYQRQLYTNTLGSWIIQIEQRLNAFLLPLLGVEPGVFVEFNVEGKLRGDFAEQYRIFQSAVGAPFVTRNEARRILNYKPLDGGDKLVTPLNVLEGGQASPQDAGDGHPDEGVDTPERASFDDVVCKTLQRADRTVTARKQAGREDWWTPDRWVNELSMDLHEQAGVQAALARFVAEQIIAKAGEAYQAGQIQDPQVIIEEVKPCLSAS